MTRSRTTPRLAAATVVVAGLLAGCGGDGGSSAASGGEGSLADQGPYAGIEIDPAYDMPTATLTDDRGAPLRLPDDLDAPVRVFFFGYTQCADVCPLVMSNLALAVARLPGDVAGDVQVVLVTSDPARDDPAALHAYLERFDPDFTGLTGDLDTITSVGDAMGVPLEGHTKLPSGGYDVAHGAQVVGYVGDRGVVVWTAPTSAEDMADDLLLMLDSATGDSGSDAGVQG